MNEIWKYSEKYKCDVSNMGNVRNTKTQKVFATKSNRNYLRNHKGTIHRMVAETWIDNPNNYSEVNHIDGNKHNNCVTNLEWATRQMNTKHAATNGLSNTAKLNWDLVKEIRDKYIPRKYSTYKLANEYGVTQGTIWQIINNKTY